MSPENEKKRKEFVEDIFEVYEKHGLGISHEDYHGCFIIRPLNDELKQWLEAADISEYKQETMYRNG